MMKMVTLIDIRIQQIDWSKLEKREGALLGDFIVIKETATV